MSQHASGPWHFELGTAFVNSAARLIIAAPDMADALRACHAVLVACRDTVGSTPDELAAIALAEAALARLEASHG